MKAQSISLNALKRPDEPVTRLNKTIAQSGLCSRREADRLIAEGCVQVNGLVVNTLGSSIRPEQDVILVNGQPLPSLQPLYLLFHKPVGVLTTRRDEPDRRTSRRTVYDLLPTEYHSVDPAGRLDKDSSGALILSNDGAFVQQLTHPKFHVPKHYRVTLNKPLTPEVLQKLTKGIWLPPEDRYTQKAARSQTEARLAQAQSVILRTPTIVEMTLVTGYNRQIRRMFERLDYEVTILTRTAIGPVQLGLLPVGKTRPLSDTEREQLLTPGS